MTTATTDRPALSRATLVALEERIGELVRFRAWYRAKRPDWSDLRALNDYELRALLRIRRTAKRRTDTRHLALGDHFAYSGTGRGSGGEL